MNMLIPDLSNKDLIIQSRVIKNRYPEFHQYILDNYPDSLSWTEKLYWYYHSLKDYPVCKVCGKPVKFENFHKGYRKYCSSKCNNSDPEKIELTKHNNIKKYGVDNISKLGVVKERKINTCLDRYGVDNISKLDTIKEKKANTCILRYGDKNYRNIEKTQQTCLKNYGVTHPSKSEVIKKRKEQTSLKNYGVTHPSKSEEILSKQRNTFNKNIIETHDDILDIIQEESNKIYLCSCGDCCKCSAGSFLISSGLYYSRKYQGIELCTIANPIDISGKNTSLELFIRGLLDKYNIEYLTNVRNIISPKELDIYIPSKQIAIECNGCYWHSDLEKHKKYHFDKYDLCKQKGVQLIQIWEDWIKTKPEIVKSIILSKLGIYKERIYARKCDIKLVKFSECKQFLEQNHLQSNSNSGIRLGLYYNDELVSVMTFGLKRRSMIGNSNHTEGEYELIRFCNKKFTQVIGGASKLINYFMNNYEFNQIVSYSSNDISNGKLYESLGFIKANNSHSSYWYVDSKSFLRYHRYKFRKSELVKMGYDPRKSEDQIMLSLPYFKIYDSGTTKWILK